MKDRNMIRYPYPIMYQPSNILWMRWQFLTVGPLWIVSVHSRCSTVAVSRMGKNMVTFLTHNLWVTILDSCYLMEVVPGLCMTFTYEYIPFYLTSILSVQPPSDKVIIHHLCPQNIVLILCRTNTFQCLRDNRWKHWLGEFSARTGIWCALAIWRVEWPIRWKGGEFIQWVFLKERWGILIRELGGLALWHSDKLRQKGGVLEWVSVQKSLRDALEVLDQKMK